MDSIRIALIAVVAVLLVRSFLQLFNIRLLDCRQRAEQRDRNWYILADD